MIQKQVIYNFLLYPSASSMYARSFFFNKYGLNEYADGVVLKEKLWPLIAQNEPSLISLQLVILLFFEFPSRIISYPAK